MHTHDPSANTCLLHAFVVRAWVLIRFTYACVHCRCMCVWWTPPPPAWYQHQSRAGDCTFEPILVRC